LHVAKGHAGVQGGRDEGVTQRVRTDPLGDPGSAGDPAHDPPSDVTVEPATVGLDEDRPVAPVTDRQVDGAGDAWGEGHGGGLAALADHSEGAMTTLESEGVDIGADRLGHAFNASSETRA
jgi:hypothetical protein